VLPVNVEEVVVDVVEFAIGNLKLPLSVRNNCSILLFWTDSHSFNWEAAPLNLVDIKDNLPLTLFTTQYKQS
jgi:hypothetical protein